MNQELAHAGRGENENLQAPLPCSPLPISDVFRGKEALPKSLTAPTDENKQNYLVPAP